MCSMANTSEMELPFPVSTWKVRDVLRVFAVLISFTGGKEVDGQGNEKEDRASARHVEINAKIKPLLERKAC